ncbi:GNAT family N-acetyltransferase [Deefgea rivuli]|uniref:GNAT family N-acetyltransferase n=1 Tax=Deefgea rivuli TaxID=400948 RepID=UPI00068622D8|nr:GNAT family protein [Deefgea rivuli]
MILRPATRDDVDFLMSLRRDVESLRFMPLNALSYAELSVRVAECADALKFDDSAELIYVLEFEGCTIGMVGARQRSAQMRYAELTYALLPQWRQRGLATQAMRMWIAQLFAVGYRRLGLMISAENTASLALANKLGFQQEGLLREHFLIGGMPQDQVVLGLLATEWQQTLQGSQNVPD